MAAWPDPEISLLELRQKLKARGRSGDDSNAEQKGGTGQHPGFSAQRELQDRTIEPADDLHEPCFSFADVLQACKIAASGGADNKGRDQAPADCVAGLCLRHAPENVTLNAALIEKRDNTSDDDRGGKRDEAIHFEVARETAQACLCRAGRSRGPGGPSLPGRQVHHKVASRRNMLSTMITVTSASQAEIDGSHGQ